MRIALGGFQHETNTFAPSPATFDDFARGGGWPPLVQGGDLLDAVAGINIPVAGAIEALRGPSRTLIPLAWAAASPSAHVTRDAYERIAGLIVERLKAAMPVDGVYLDLHGAMVTEHLDDGEGELLERVPVVASLDLHANVTRRMVEHADLLVAYRTYPHVDMAETGARAAAFLLQRLKGAPRPRVSMRRIPFLIPLQVQCTMLEPAQSLYAALPRMENERVVSASFTPGFPAADFPECGPVVLAYGRDAAATAAAAEQLRADVEGREADFDYPVYAPEEGVRRALQIADRANRPVVIADTQDNPGAGGNSDTTGMLRALVGADAQRAALGIVVDANAARIAHAAGPGATVELNLGGKSGIPGDAPFAGRFVVERLSDGRVQCTGPFYRGARMTLGPSACLRMGGVRVVVACEKAQLADQEQYRYVGIEPTQQAVLVNKSSVHFRADFAPIAGEILVCRAPGPMLADTSRFPWTNLAPGIRLKPRGPVFARP
jgi:microcystin degradation protein MlrC